MKKLFLGVMVGFFLAGPTAAVAMPKYEPYCMFSGCGGVSGNGDRAIFTFDEPLDRHYPGSGPHTIYQRSGGRTTVLFDFPPGKARPVRLIAVSDDARRAIVQTRSPLAPEDIDGFGDDYFAIQDGVPTLLSWDPAEPATAADADLRLSFIRASDDARTVYFSRTVRTGGTMCQETLARSESALTRLPLGCFQWIEGVSRDGTNVYLHADPGDPSSGSRWNGSIFRLRDGAFKELSGFPPAATTCTRSSQFGDATEDGETLLFTSNHPAAPGDTDDDYDVYVRHPDGSFELLTDTPDDGHTGCSGRLNSEPDHPIGLSADGQSALFATESQLVPHDTDSSMDIYLHRSGMPPALVSTGPTDDNSEVRNPAYGGEMGGWSILHWRVDASDDLTTIVFDTKQRLVPEDRDNSTDVYMWRDGETELVSTGPSATGAELEAKLLGISNDGSRVAFTTMEPLVAADRDDRMDIYTRATGQIVRTGDEATVSSASGKKKPKRRTPLLSAESIPPRMKLGGRLRQLGKRYVRVRLVCPRTEQTGPCRGAVLIRPLGRRGAAGAARFRIATGRARVVTVKLRRPTSRGWRARVRVRAADALGNRIVTDHRRQVRSP